MTDIEIVIKIPEEMYERIKDGCVPLGISRYLKNGVQLPKGHGPLIDAKFLYDTFEDVLEHTPNVIGADTGSEG